MNRLLKWNFKRNFGIEYEFNNDSSSLQNMARITRGFTRKPCEIHDYEHTYENFSNWVAKTDSSCGVGNQNGTELVTPILHGPVELKKATDILLVLQEGGFEIDRSCGQHVHIEITDYDVKQVGILAAYWMKTERFILNGTPSYRRSNEHCNMLTQLHPDIDPSKTYTPEEIFRNLIRGRNAINFGRWNAERGGTVEFRFGEMTFDPEIVKNRVRFLIWLVEICKILPLPTNLKWFTPKQALSVFNLWENPKSFIKYTYSPAIQSMRKWLIKRVIEHSPPIFQKDKERCQVMLEEIQRSETA